MQSNAFSACSARAKQPSTVAVQLGNSAALTQVTARYMQLSCRKTAPALITAAAGYCAHYVSPLRCQSCLRRCQRRPVSRWPLAHGELGAAPAAALTSALLGAVLGWVVRPHDVAQLLADGLVGEDAIRRLRMHAPSVHYDARKPTSARAAATWAPRRGSQLAISEATRSAAT